MTLAPQSEISESSNRVRWPQLLVVTGYEPGDQHVGAILASQVLSTVPRSNYHVVAIPPRNLIHTESELVDRRLERRYECSFRPFSGPLGTLTEMFGNWLHKRYVGSLAAECCLEAARHQCDAVLVVMESPTLIMLAERLAKRLNVPLFCFVMDGPILQARNLGYSASRERDLIATFNRALSHAQRLAVAGESMRDAYRARFGKVGCILRQGLTYHPHPGSSNLADGPLRIGFAGSISAKDAFDSLLSGLQRRSWRLAGRDVVFRVAGTQLKVAPEGPMRIEYLGWRSVTEAIQLMSECDILYMPQPFDQSQSEFAGLSFPNKMCTYVPTRRPIALHAPRHASLWPFFERHACGPKSSELNADDLLDQIEQTVGDRSLYQHYVTQVDEVFRETLNEESLAASVRQFLSMNN